MNLVKPPFTLSEPFLFAWKSFIKNLQPFLIIISILVLLTLLPEFLDKTLFGNNAIIFYILQTVAFLLQAYVSITVYKLVLNWHDHQQIGLAKWSEINSRFVPYVFILLLYALVVVGGIVLLIIPAILWSVWYGFAQLIAIDQKVGVFEAFAKSRELTRGHFWILFSFGAATLALGLAEGVITKLTSFVITEPFIVLATVYVYRKLEKR